MSDIIERYDAAEQSGIASISNAAIAAFRLSTFDQVGFPTRVHSLQELWRYHDSMQDGRFETNLRYLDQASIEEVELCRTAAEVISRFAEDGLKRPTPGRDALSRALLQYHLIGSILHNVPRPWRLVEIGPGSGYLGLLIGLAGHHYEAVEACQAFYIYQNRLWTFAFGDTYLDGLSAGSSEAIVRHVPWWNVCKTGFMFSTTDLFVSNHALAEMTPPAMRRIFQLARKTHPKSVRILAEGLGKPRTPHRAVLSTAAGLGFGALELAGTIRDAWLFEAVAGVTPVIDSRDSSSRIRLLWRKILRLPVVGQPIRRIERGLRGCRVSTGQSSDAAGGAEKLRNVFSVYPTEPLANEQFMKGL